MQIKLFGLTIFSANKDTPVEASTRGGQYETLSSTFTGEKNSGDLGPAKEYFCDHDMLRTYSWQLFLESDICQIVFTRFGRWIIGSGLKLQAKPAIDILESEKIKLSTEDFNNIVESRFDVYSESKMADYSKMKSLNKIALKALTNALVGGDVLVVLRVEGNNVTVQLVDGANISNPGTVKYTPWGDMVAENGNRIKHGVEVDATGQHIAYHVRTGLMKWDRIQAKGEKSGALMAFMVYGLEYRLDNIRGIPLISAVMETAKKMDRYKEATLGSAEENAKMPFTIAHKEFSTGENPFIANFAKASGVDVVPETINGEQLANRVAATTNKQVYNLPVGAELKSHDSTKELYFEPFFTVNIGLVCATVGIPPEVAMMKYESNYSASRAAIKDWEHSLLVSRKDFSDQFYKNIYALWLNIQVLTNKVQAPGYLTALVQRDDMILESYRSASWLGANVPHIDPLKEVMAERAKLGEGAAHLPMTTLEEATKNVNGGDSWPNMNQYAKELEEAEKLNIEKITTAAHPLNTVGAANKD